MRKGIALLLVALFLISGVVIGNPVPGAIAVMDTWVSKEPIPTERTF
jgi:hypothetical protein